MRIILRTAVLLYVLGRTAVFAFAGFVTRAGRDGVFEEVALALCGGEQLARPDRPRSLCE